MNWLRSQSPVTRRLTSGGTRLALLAGLLASASCSNAECLALPLPTLDDAVNKLSDRFGDDQITVEANCALVEGRGVQVCRAATRSEVGDAVRAGAANVLGTQLVVKGDPDTIPEVLETVSSFDSSCR